VTAAALSTFLWLKLPLASGLDPLKYAGLGERFWGMNRTTEYLQSESAEANIDVPTLVNHLLGDAIQAGASDLHLEPWETAWWCGSV